MRGSMLRVERDTSPGEGPGHLARVRNALGLAVSHQVSRALPADGRFDARMLRDWVEEALVGVRLVVVSNREPYSHGFDAGRVQVIRNPGGLVVALDAVLRATGGVWVAHGSGAADRESSGRDGRLRVPPEDPAYVLARVWLSPEELDGYYSGCSNGALWPLCHQAYVRPRFERGDWETYQRVNRRFARAAVEAAGDGPAVILLQDYHLATCALHIKAERPDIPVALFWHIPWPNPETFRILPWKEELLEGLLANDLLGFHLRAHCVNFLDTVAAELESRVDPVGMAVHRHRHRTRVRAFPIGTDVEGIAEHAGSTECRRNAELWRERLGLAGFRVGVGVDRLDYTKGIPERLAGLERLFERQPRWRDRFKFVQIAVPSRVALPEYRELAERIEGQVTRLNKRFDGPSGPVVQLLKGDFDFRDVVAFYRLGDVAAVTSLHDGMNLVAKEYVAARKGLGGALVLSPFTGAARELHQALLANPYDADALASAFHEALTQEPEVERARMDSLRSRLYRDTIFDWARALLDSVRRLGPGANFRGER
jgi:trehalose-6-phosphate synthase